jgi:3-deoxy-manno-octulosonate cytidylyltransferase (CMP-KDO synthetase)
VVGVIPARYASSRLPGKLLADIGGVPMVVRTYRRAVQARLLDTLLVAADDARIVAAVEQAGGRARMTSPSHASGTDRVAEVAEGMACDLVVNIQGDEPLIEPAVIDAAVAPLLADPGIAMGTLACPIRDPAVAADPDAVKVVVDLAGFALYFSRATIPYRRGEGAGRSASALEPHAATPWLKHIGLYVYRRDFLLRFAKWEPTRLERLERLEQLRALEHGARIAVTLTDHDSIGVDTPADLVAVRRLIAGGRGEGRMTNDQCRNPRSRSGRGPASARDLASATGNLGSRPRGAAAGGRRDGLDAA